MPTITLEAKTAKTAKVKPKGSILKAAPVPKIPLEFRIKKHLGIITTQGGRKVKAFSTTDSHVQLVMFPLLPCGTLRGDYFEMKTTQLRAEVRVALGY